MEPCYGRHRRHLVLAPTQDCRALVVLNAVSAPVRRPIEVFRVNPAAFWITIFASLLLQVFLPLKISFARLFDFPLLVTVYFALVRRNKIFAIGLGTGLGLVQDLLSHGFFGTYGMAKALVGYLAASASVKLNLERVVPRLLLTGILILVHQLFLLGLERELLESHLGLQPVDLAISMMMNVAVGLVLFQVLDHFKRPP